MRLDDSQDAAHTRCTFLLQSNCHHNEYFDEEPFERNVGDSSDGGFHSAELCVIVPTALICQHADLPNLIFQWQFKPGLL